MGNNIDIDLFTQKSEITTSTPDITIEITGLVQLNSFIGLDDTPTYYENGKFFKVEDNKIVYTDINWSDVKGKIKDNPELVKEIGEFIQKETEQYTSEAVTKAIKSHDADANAHQSIQLTIQDNYATLDNKIELNKIDSNTKFDEVNKKVSDNTEYITRVDNYSQEVNKKLEDLTLEVDVDIKGDINQLREDLTTTNQVVQDNYTALDTKIDNTKTELDTKIDTTKAELTKDISDKYTALDTRISANTKDITDLTQIVQDDYKEINGHITDLYNKKVDKVEGKELSTNDFTDELKSKLENIETTAQVNIIESISVDSVPQTIDSNKNVDLHQPVYTLVEKDTPADTNIKEYNLTIDGTTTGVTIEIPKDVYIEKCTLKYATVVDTPYTGAKVNDAYLQFDRANSTPIYTPITELQIHAGQDITVDENNTISTVIPIPRKISELKNDNYTVTDENYVHTDNNFTDGYIGRIESLEATTVKNVEYNKTTQKITVTFGDTTTKILTLEELLTGASYDGETGNFTFTRANGEPVVVNTPKENFLSDVQYDGTTKVITFTMSSGATFEINVSDLIDVYTVKSTNSVDMSIENGNEISSNVKVSTTDGNIISVKTDGIYAEHQDISHLATKDEVNTKVDTATFTNELAKKADKTDVETELAKKVDTTTYTTGLATKVDKVEGKSLIENTEIERLKTLKNYDDTQIKTDITNINSVLETKASTTDLENGLKTKQDKLTFDTTPTANSSNPVTSGGIKNELDKKVNSTTLTTELAKKQNKLTAGTGIKIEGDVISNTQTSAEWGNIQGDITAQEDLQTALDSKQDKGNYALKSEIPTKISQLTDDSTFVHKTGNETVAGVKTFSSTISGSINGSAEFSKYLGNHNETVSSSIASAPSAGMAKKSGLFLTGTYNDSATPVSYGNIINIAGSGSGQLLCEWSGFDNTTGGVYYRSHRDTSTGGWGAWKKLAFTTDNVTSATKATQDSNGNNIANTYATKVELNTKANSSLSNLTEAGKQVIKDNSGGGLEICDIGMALYVDETKGLRRYLNGQIVDINTNTQAFLNRLKEITTLHPSLLCTEDEWQTAKTMSAFGQVGKFVFNYNGDEVVSVRIPRVVNIQGVFDLQNLGMTVGAGLPNITGTWYSYGLDNAIRNTTGAFSPATWRGNGYNGHQSKAGQIDYINFDASLSNPIYGNSDTVQPEAIQYPYFIQIATGAETENNIINEIELNNPYSLFDSKYSDHELNNLSWLKSEGQWNAKTVYTDAYDKLLKVHNGTETVEGLSVKLSTETYTDYDFVLNTTDETFRLPLLDGSETLPTGEIISQSIPLTGNSYYAIGYNCFVTIRLEGCTHCRLWDNTQNRESWTTGSVGFQGKTLFMPKGHQLGLYYQNGTMTKFTFQKAKGNGSLYYYVGETVQNANLIDAGRIGEQLATKTDMQQAAKASMPSNKYIDLTLNATGSSYTAPADGWVVLVYQTSKDSTAWVEFTQDSDRVTYCCFKPTGMSGWIRLLVPVAKGLTFGISHKGLASGYTPRFKFFYAVGSEPTA